MKQSEVRIYKPEDQGSGEFDNGKITEIKPIDFPGGTGAGKRLGPLFYWAWASANGDGVIGMHPHQAFEIMSYGLVGEIGHSDSLNNKTRVGPGGAQLIQAGSGIYHQEEMYGERTEFFQIWFEPNLRETIKHDPFYGQYENEEFPVTESESAIIKNVIGNEAPLKIVSDVLADDIVIKAGKSLTLDIYAERSMAFNLISGTGKLVVNESEYLIEAKDYVNVESDEDMSINIEASGVGDLRIFKIDVPKKVDYQLYGE